MPSVNEQQNGDSVSGISDSGTVTYGNPLCEESPHWFDAEAGDAPNTYYRGCHDGGDTHIRQMGDNVEIDG